MRLQLTLLFFGAIFGIIQTAASESGTNCAALGFKETLLCSTCVDLENFIKDEEIVNDCKRCCAEEKDTSTKQFYSVVTLKIDSWKMSRFPHIQEFVDKHSYKYPNFRLEWVGGMDPTLYMQEENGKTESQTIDSWKTENLIEFLDEKLLPGKGSS